MIQKIIFMIWLSLVFIQCKVLNASPAVKEGTASFKVGSADTRDFLGIPPFLMQAAGKPSVILALDTSGSMLNSAYENTALKDIANGFDASHGDTNTHGIIETRREGYQGYFNPTLQYRYDESIHVFMEDSTLSRGDALAWDGSFLNWLTMRRIDVARKALIGGKVRQREGQLINGTKMWVLEGEVEFNASDALRFQDPQSAQYSPITNNALITIEKGQIKVASTDLISQSYSVNGFKIRLAVQQEPKGLIQANRQRVNFGLSVYNFDHKLNTEVEMMNNNQVDGQTMHPCYPLFDQERLLQRQSEDASDDNMKMKSVSLYSGMMRDYLCLPTGVHAPNEKIVQVIEEYPLIWGATPIAEGMVDIGNYIRQKTPYYDLGHSPFGVYGVDGGYQDNGFRWDPYYDAEQGEVLPCKKVYILHLNDGAPNRDYDEDVGETRHLETSPHYQDIPQDPNRGANESIDSVAMALRGHDCRHTDLRGEQNIVSYYVYLPVDGDDQKAIPLRRLMEAAARGGFIDDKNALNNTVGFPDPLWPIDTNGREYTNFYTYSQLSPSECPMSEWDGNGDCIPDTFYEVDDANGVFISLQNALNDMLARAVSGGSASIIASSSSAEGVVYQARFAPSVTLNEDTVKWVGDVSALMVDQQGRLRSDDGDGRLESTLIDPVYSACFDVENDKVRVKLSSDDASISAQTISEECTAANGYTQSENDVGYLWRANDVLSSLSDSDVQNQRSFYGSASKNRYIKTNIPTNNPGSKNAVEDFLPASFTQNLVGLLNTKTISDAANVVNYIRGVDQTGMRSRKLNNQTQRLGDIIYSSPAVVGAPAENFHLMYNDTSYLDFFTHYKNRRTMIYVGGNDGMLHAFNGGWYNKTRHQFSAVKPGYTEWVLGQETWGFVPYNVLPYLRYLSKPDYGVKETDHAYFIDQSPYVFDAKIFGQGEVSGQADTQNGPTHPNGWGTLLVVGFRTGGGVSEVYADPRDESSIVTIRPAYLIFDITDPEQEPKLLAEFTHEKLGSSMSTPTALTVGHANRDDWYLVFGSGPSATVRGRRHVISEQNAHLFMFNLKTLRLEDSFGNAGELDLEERNAFVGDIVAVDMDLDGTTDAAYFGTVSALDGTEANLGEPLQNWGGRLFRLRVEKGMGQHQWRVDLMFDAEAPIPMRPNVSFDKNNNRWVHVGTGRFYTENDLNSDAPNFLYGLKEPRHPQGEFEMDMFTATPQVINAESLVDVSQAVVKKLSGQLNHSIMLTPALTADTVEALETRQRQYRDSEGYTSGWKKTLLPGERAMGASSVLGGVLSQSTYTPDAGVCRVTGKSYLYALRYTTGTAWFNAILKEANRGVNNDASIEKLPLGVTPSLSPSIHLGEARAQGEATIISINSDHSMSMNIEHNLEGIVSKEVGWREL